jgi:hypothetical protein
LLGLPAQPRRRWLPVLPHRCSVWRTCSISRRGHLNHDLPPCPHMGIIRYFRSFRNLGTSGRCVNQDLAGALPRDVDSRWLLKGKRRLGESRLLWGVFKFLDVE